MFEGGQQEFQCEIGLFRKLPGTQLFASIVTPEVELDLGEEVQLRSIVRSGDGKAADGDFVVGEVKFVCTMLG